MVFESSYISGIQVANKIFRSATHDGLADETGAPSKALIRKYENLAKSSTVLVQMQLGQSLIKTIQKLMQSMQRQKNIRKT